MKYLFLVLILCGCTDDTASRDTLRKAGFTDIHITGWSPFVCGDDDTFSTGFKAKNPGGIVVEGTVCCGFITKGCTIRF